MLAMMAGLQWYAARTITNALAKIKEQMATVRRAADDLDPVRRKLAREVRGIRVDGEAEEELVADGDDFDLHCRALGALGALEALRA